LCRNITLLLLLFTVGYHCQAAVGLLAGVNGPTPMHYYKSLHLVIILSHPA